MQRIRASITFTYGGPPGVITLYTTTASGEDSASAALTGDRLRDALTAGHDLFMTNCSFKADSFVDTINPATGELTASDSYGGWTVAGTQSMGALPPQTMICATWITAAFVGGRRVRGRTFLGPLDNSTLQTDGTLASTALTHANALGTSWYDAGLTDTLAVVWHRPVGGAGGSAHEIIGHSVKDKFAVLRSRRD